MAYPFANNQYAQSSSQGQHGYNDPYAQQPHQFGSSAAQFHDEEPHYSNLQESYEGQPRSMANEDTLRDGSATAPYTAYPGRQHGLYDTDINEKDGSAGGTPYERSPYVVGTTPYAGKSIWTVDDKRVMARRGVAAKIFRTLFCVVINAIIVIISIICLVVIFARPPNVGIGSDVAPSASSVGVSGSALTLNGSVDFVVSNPNAISATLSELTANIYDTVDTSQVIGTGSVSDQKIASQANTTITFPYQIRYDSSKDTNQTILKDLNSKCGLTGGTVQDLDLSLKVSAKLKILSVPIPISFSEDISFACPLTAANLKSLGVSGLSGLLRRSEKEVHQLPSRQEL
ncbi:hypothetical protein CBS101457_003582 [Exobasidium rhododendri]|nr:hypothetical protein CBS101457_003582 [Exobasidium rhododendri]